MCIYLHIHAVKNTTICQMLSLCNMQHNVTHNYMFWPCKWAIISLFVEPAEPPPHLQTPQTPIV